MTTDPGKPKPVLRSLRLPYVPPDVTLVSPSGVRWRPTGQPGWYTIADPDTPGVVDLGLDKVKVPNMRLGELLDDYDGYELAVELPVVSTVRESRLLAIIGIQIMDYRYKYRMDPYPRLERWQVRPRVIEMMLWDGTDACGQEIADWTRPDGATAGTADLFKVGHSPNRTASLWMEDCGAWRPVPVGHRVVKEAGSLYSVAPLDLQTFELVRCESP